MQAISVGIAEGIGLSEPEVEDVYWGALLHDIGKVRTRKIEPNGQVHFFGHSEVGAAMFRKRVAARLGFEGALYDTLLTPIVRRVVAATVGDD